MEDIREILFERKLGGLSKVLHEITYLHYKEAIMDIMQEYAIHYCRMIDEQHKNDEQE